MVNSGRYWLVAFTMITLGSSTLWGGLEYKYLYLESKEHIGAMVHLMEWSYNDIKNECEFLKQSGYNGVLISPPVEHVQLDETTWKERYMTISLKLITRSGTLEELEEMLYHCAKKYNLRVYADINLNHMLQSTTKGEVKGAAGSIATPSLYKYDGITKQEFHKYCKLTKEDHNNAQKIKECEVDDLQDLDSDSESLQDKHVAMLNKLIDMGISGFS